MQSSNNSGQKHAMWLTLCTRISEFLKFIIKLTKKEIKQIYSISTSVHLMHNASELLQPLCALVEYIDVVQYPTVG